MNKRIWSIARVCLLSLGAVLCADTGEVSRRVTQLGAESFAEREAASLALWTLGEAALAELRVAAKSPDPEVRLRAAELVEQIELGMRPSWPEDLRKRAKAYRADSRDLQEKFLRELMASEKKEAFPFLLWRAGARESDAGIAVNLLLQHLRDLLNQNEFAEMDALTGAWMKVLAGEGRFLYLRAAALANLHQGEAAVALCQKALTLHPDDQVKHYAAAELLEELKQLPLARMEWQRVLDIPPQDDVYDLNAHMKIGRIHAMQKEYDEAADAFETGLRLFRKAKADGAGWGMTLTEAELEERIAKLREKALEQRKNQESVTIRVSQTVKKDGEAELERLRKRAECRMTLTIQPYGLRLFDNADATLAYDPVGQKLQVLLNGSAWDQTVPATFKSEKPLVAVETLDMWFFYELNLAENSSRLVASFELDYVLHFEPSPRLAAWDSPGMSLNGTPHTWKALEDGIPFDFLPETLIMELKGRTPEGKESDLRLETDADRLKHMQDKP